jgi:hypothetical protein
VLQSTSIAWERIASRRRPAFSSHLISSFTLEPNLYLELGEVIRGTGCLIFFFSVHAEAFLSHSNLNGGRCYRRSLKWISRFDGTAEALERECG